MTQAYIVTILYIDADTGTLKTSDGYSSYIDNFPGAQVGEKWIKVIDDHDRIVRTEKMETEE